MSSAGQEAVELAASAGLVLDPWQVEVLEVALGERSDGRWSAFEVGLVVPRQNGKGSILEARELAGLFLFGEQLILHSAHEFKTAAEAFRRILSLVQSTPDLERRVMRVRTSHGDEGIELRGGQRLRFVARSTGSGRGFSGDTVILDEAYNLSDRALSALFPTMAARENPQIWYTSSAPLLGEESSVLRRICKRGRLGEPGRLAFMEWCAEDGADPKDPAAWAQANPAFGVRVTEEFVLAEMGALLDEDFARERLGLWVDPDDTADSVLPMWGACESPGSVPVKPWAFALDVSVDRGWAAFAVSGGGHVEVVDHREGTAWVVARAKDLRKRWGARFAVAASSPAASLIPDLRAAGVDVVEVSTADHARACGALFDAVAERQVRHLGQQPLNAAVAGAVKRLYGDAWMWSRKASTVDICPLVAVTLAKWLADQPPEAKPVFAH